jgi:hypothetical protein
MEPGNDPRLKQLLHEWQVPDAPASLEKRVFARPRPWWRSLMGSRVRVPLPVAVAFSIALMWLAVLAVRDARPAVEPLSTSYDLRGFQPVKSVHVRIERSSDATR